IRVKSRQNSRLEAQRKSTRLLSVGTPHLQQVSLLTKAGHEERFRWLHRVCAATSHPSWKLEHNWDSGVTILLDHFRCVDALRRIVEAFAESCSKRMALKNSD